jgi:hypothetical protein
MTGWYLLVVPYAITAAVLLWALTLNRLALRRIRRMQREGRRLVLDAAARPVRSFYAPTPADMDCTEQDPEIVARRLAALGRKS